MLTGLIYNQDRCTITVRVLLMPVCLFKLALPAARTKISHPYTIPNKVLEYNQDLYSVNTEPKVRSLNPASQSKRIATLQVPPDLVFRHLNSAETIQQNSTSNSSFDVQEVAV